MREIIKTMKNLTHLFDTKMKYQKYSHYLLPINSDPLNYGKLIEQLDNKYIIQLNTSNILVIKVVDNENFIRFFRRGNLMLEFVDKKITEKMFTRTISDQRFTFENNKLITTEILSSVSNIKIYEDTDALLNKNNPLNLIENSYINKKPELFNIDFIFDWIDNSKDPLKAFLIWELCIILVLYIIFVILPDQLLNIDNNLTLASMSSGNIIKLKKTTSKYKWEDLNFNIKNKLFSQSLFEKIFNQFWKQIETNFTDNNHMFILFKIKYITGQTLSIGNLQRVNNKDKKWYSEFIINFIELKASFYKETQIESLIFSYGFKDGKVKNKQEIIYDGLYQNYNNYQIPISTNPMDYGLLINKIDMKDSVAYFLHNEKGLTIAIRTYIDYNLIEFFKSGTTLLKFTDELIDNNKFMRRIDNKIFTFKDGRQILLSSELKTKFISKSSKCKNLVNKFITIDIETYITDGLLTPYLICFYDGKNFFSFYLSDYNSVEEMMLECLKSILKRKYKGYNIYAHNLAKFDIIFLLKYLLKLGSIKPIIHNGKIISLRVNYGKNKEYRIEFKDSLLLLLTSLDSLCKSFKIEESKTIFPHLFVNENNLNYNGEVPKTDDFLNINKKEYQDYKLKYKNWNLKTEAIKYCKIDCISLYHILLKFNDMIFGLFSKNIHDYPTLSSLAFSIYRSNFMKENTIPQLTGQIAKNIRSGYTGGAVDMYIPNPPKGVKINCYDVNSLYPSQMQSQLMPIGNPTYFNGNILDIDKDVFGFFYCEIIAPDNIKHPILQTRVKINGVNKTIAPIGSWEDMLFSEEMKNAIKHGYKINVLWGYTFKSENIFKDYVEFLYKLRSQYPSSDPMNFIAKILLNSLYGRFGMDDNFPTINIIHKDYYPDFENKFIDQIMEKIEIDDYMLVFFNSSNSLIEDQEEHNVSVGIAAAITAYARIHMSQFKNNPKINLYYTDTDSIYTDSELDSSLISNKILGKLKLENVCNKAIFLGPKLYCLLTESGQFIHKVKGLNRNIMLEFKDFEILLEKNSFIGKLQSKWFRNLTESKINILDQLYTIKHTNNKRKLIYNKNNKLIGTESYIINKDKTIKN
jgi:DNA polymerase family B